MPESIALISATFPKISTFSFPFSFSSISISNKLIPDSIPCFILAIAFGIVSLKTSGYLIDSRSFLIASLLFLIIFIVTLHYPYISVSSFILAITLGVIGIKKDEKGMAISGLVLGLIPLSIYVFSVTSFLIMFGLFGD